MRERRSTVSEKLSRSALAAIAAFTMSACIGGSGGETTKADSNYSVPTTPGNQDPEIAKNAEALRSTRSRLTSEAVPLTRQLLAAMAQPGKGMKAYKGNIFDNKSTVAGPDYEQGTADDAKYRGIPAYYASYSEDEGIYVSSIDVTMLDGLKTFDAYAATFQVTKDNPIRQAFLRGQLQLADFSAALQDPTKLQLVDLELRHDWYFNGATRTSRGTLIDLSFENEAIATILEIDGEKLIEDWLNEGSTTTTIHNINRVANAFIGIAPNVIS